MNDCRRLNTRASGLIAAAVLCSRVLGLIREMLFAGLFGSALMGIFTIAFRAPNLLRDLFAEGALSTAFITVFSQKIEKEGERSAWALASKMMTLATIFMSLISLLGVVFAKQLIDILAPGFAPEDATSARSPAEFSSAGSSIRLSAKRHSPASPSALWLEAFFNWRSNFRAYARSATVFVLTSNGEIREFARSWC